MTLRSILLGAALLLLPAAVRAGELPALPHAATSFGAATAEGSVYIYGGNTGKAHEFHRDCISGDFLRLSSKDGAAWEKLPGGPGLLSAGLAEYKGTIIRAGGMQAMNAKGERDDLRSVDTVVRFQPGKGEWETLPPLPQPRSSHDLVVFGDTLYAGGGWELGKPENHDKRDGDWQKTLVKLDLTAPEKGWTSEPQPFQRRALAMVVQGDRIWFLGGMDEHDAPSTEVDWLEPKTGKWGKGPALPEGPMRGFGMAACVLDGKLVASPVTGKLYTLSTDGSKWEENGQLQKPRFFHRLVALDATRMLAVGGSGRAGHVLEPEIVTLGAAAQASPPATEKAAPSKESATTEKPEPKQASAWPQWRGPSRDGVSVEHG